MTAYVVTDLTFSDHNKKINCLKVPMAKERVALYFPANIYLLKVN